MLTSMNGGSDDSAEWAAWAQVIKGDPKTYAETKEAMREIATRVAARTSGSRMACGTLFGGGNGNGDA